MYYLHYTYPWKRYYNVTFNNLRYRCSQLKGSKSSFKIHNFLLLSIISLKILRRNFQAKNKILSLLSINKKYYKS